MIVSTMENAEQMEVRFVDIEIKLAQQEDLVESLNQMVYQQGKRIDQLEAMLHKLGEHVRDGAQQANGGPVNDRPPHY
jgi:SlyX protein